MASTLSLFQRRVAFLVFTAVSPNSYLLLDAMTKRVNFDEELNQVREFERIPREEKLDFWVSKAEIKLFRQEMQAEALMEQAQTLVKTTVLELSNKTEEDDEVRQIVEGIMLQGIDGVLDFLSKHGKSILPSDTTPESNSETNAANANPELQVRNMVKHKLIVVRKDTFLSQEELELQVDQIMKLPRPNIVEFLEQTKPLEKPPPPVAPAVAFNWMTDSTDYWGDLPYDVQLAAGDLGYNEAAWNGGTQPEESDKVWEDLTPNQQVAAVKIGYNAYTWDGIQPPVALSQEQIMMQKIREMVQQKMRKEHPDMPEQEFGKVIDKIMTLPKETIKEYLQKPLAISASSSSSLKKQEKIVTDVSDSDEGEEGDSKESDSSDEDENMVAGFVLDVDDDDNKPMDDDSSSNEEIMSGFVLDVNDEDNEPMDDDSSSSEKRENDTSEQDDDGSSPTSVDDHAESPMAEPATTKVEENELLYTLTDDSDGEKRMSDLLQNSQVGLDNMYVPSDDEMDRDDDDDDETDQETFKPLLQQTQQEHQSSATSLLGGGEDSLRRRSLAAAVTDGDDKDEATPLLKSVTKEEEPQKAKTKLLKRPILILPGVLLLGYGIYIVGSLLHKKVQ